ncbi:MAG: sigma 54-interacting transcriptional regulator [Deltaproteobacteria bacterium]|nr:sigma 54-interacting transcriptional regulator [Deltaproteobacteria bacterium]
MVGETSTQVVRGGEPGGPRRRVVVVMIDGAVTTHALPERGAVTLGRGAEVEIRVEHRSVSRRHAAIELDGDVRIRDLGSANGTTVRGALLPRDRAIALGANETFMLGEVAVVVQERRSVAPGAAVAAKPAADGAAIEPVLVEPAMLNLFDLARRVAAGTINALVTGESGAGKELLAEAIHRASPRAGGPLVRVNCAALSDTLIESELFGHERGAFTGAVGAKAGMIEAADGGTLFLDEVGELSASAQAKLLRVIEDRVVCRVGATSGRTVDVRFVAATNRDLEAEAAAGRFRADLYFRLAGIVLDVPPLRERPADLEPLARAFIARAAAALGRPVPALEAEAIAALRAHAWPGNVRELRNAIERAVLLAPGAITAAALFGAARPAASVAPAAPPDDERARIVAALEACAGNQTRAAKALGISLRTLVNRIEQYDLPRPKRR